MAIRVSSLVPNNSTDAQFRAWINEIHNSLIAFGWLQTADTGQINFTTVGRPTAGSTYQGYAIYQMNDALQSACAVFIRLDFGTNANTDTPGMKFQICIGGTNGAGTLTGNVSAVLVLGCDTVVAGTAFNGRTAGTSSSFRMSMWPHSASAARGWSLVIERDLNTAGVEQSTGVSWAYINHAGGSTAVFGSQFLETAGGTGTLTTVLYAMVHSLATQSGGGNVGVGPVRTQLGPFRNPMKGLLIYAKGDFADQTTNPVSIYGSTHTYVMLRDIVGAQNFNGLNADTGWALLWE